MIKKVKYIFIVLSLILVTMMTLTTTVMALTYTEVGKAPGNAGGQGFTINGEYYFTTSVDGNNNGTITVTNKKGEKVGNTVKIRNSHINDLTYDTKRNKLIVAAFTQAGDNNVENYVYDFDKSKAKLKNQKTLEVGKNSGVAYNSMYDQIIVYSASTIKIYNAEDFYKKGKPLKTFKTKDENYVRQGIATNGNYLYKAYYDTQTKNACIKVYDMTTGKLVETLKQTKVKGEIESIAFGKDGTMYVYYHDKTLYKTDYNYNTDTKLDNTKRDMSLSEKEELDKLNELRRQEESKADKKQEEQKKQEEEKKKQEEQKKQEEAKKKQEEQKNKQEEQNKKEEENKKQEEQKAKQEEQNKQDEVKATTEEQVEDEVLEEVQETQQEESKSVKTHTLEEIIREAEEFINAGNKTKISEENMKKMSDTVYNILLTIGIVVAFVIGGILGIKFVTGGIKEKAEIKNMLIPYIVGLVVLFGAFTIWKIVVTILQQT